MSYDVKDEIRSVVSIGVLAGSKMSRIRCPFHRSERLDMALYHDNDTWRCWGKCNTWGDIFDWVELQEGVDFKEALRRLADMAGIPLQPSEERTEILTAATRFYHDQLVHHPDVVAYLHKRGFSDEHIFTRQLGYAHSTDFPTNVAIQKLERVGLIQRGMTGPYPWFRDRITYPVFDFKRNIIQIQGRQFPNDDAKPKYMALRDDVDLRGRSIYQCLGGEELLGDPTLTSVLLAEGWPDRETLAAWGIPAVNIFGHSGMEKHAHKFKHVKTIFTVLDPDAASQSGILDNLWALNIKVPFIEIKNILLDTGGMDLNDWAMSGKPRGQFLSPRHDEDKIEALRGMVKSARPLIEDLILHWGNKPHMLIPLVQLIARKPPAERDRWTNRLAGFLGEDRKSVDLLIRVHAAPELAPKTE